MAENRVLEIDSIRKAHGTFVPKPASNPAAANFHRDLGVALDHIDWLKHQLALIAQFNPDWDRLKATEDSLREHMQLLATAETENEKLQERIEGHQFTIEKWIAEASKERQRAERYRQQRDRLKAQQPDLP